MSRLLIAATLLLPSPVAGTTPIPARFESTGADRVAIQALLDSYAKAVSTKDQALFESLLLDKDIPFSGVPLPAGAAQDAAAFRNYEGFRRGVFEGPPFTQAFRDVHIRQDGPLADVSLVFVNTAPRGTTWGWKTLQLLKVAGRWKIASEFYTGHR